MLLIDSGQSESYEEPLHVEAKDKWELVMNDKMEYEEPNMGFGWAARR